MTPLFGIAYDSVGNLTTINYPASPDVTLQYDGLNRLTNMVDGAGTTKYSYNAAGQLLTEDGDQHVRQSIADGVEFATAERFVDQRVWL